MKRLATVWAIALGALSASSLLPASVAAVGGPSIPGLPGVPHIHVPKPDQTAVFDVIVEGKATDHNTSQLTGQDAACLVAEDGTVDETDTYLRGKDVNIEFDRYGHAIVMKRDRGGQLGDTSLAVNVTVRRTAGGNISYVPTAQALSCPQPLEFSKGPDCDQTRTVGGSPAMVLGWNDGHVSLDVSRRTISNSRPVNRCGENKQTGITNQLFYAWPNLAKMYAVLELPAREIFNRRIHTIAITLQSPRGDRLPPHTVRWTAGLLNGTVTDTTDNHATVRLIRVR